ncbi:MAG: hypothetical protein ABUL62_05060 [Myxococcales bacterium]
MSIETLSLTVPAEHRGEFLARAARLLERSEARGVSATERELALGVLSVLCGAAKALAEPALGAEP